ncbi:MAG: DNA-3-methyladenine glycosylase 2 family protein [Betaproteobacteria bacterium]|nr:DNA-3-methyladenine glycosylase 2 family protein [Betaproteobacteria bacterium]
MSTPANHHAEYLVSLREAERVLARADPLFRRLIRDHGPCELAPQWQRSPYESLVRSITFQQLHGKAATAILARFVALFPGHRFPPPDKVLARADEDFQGVGLSRQKLGYIRDVADKAVQGIIPIHRRGLRNADNDELIARFTQAKGVGRWSVEMMLIFSLGRLDVLPVDDYGVRAGFSKAKKLQEMIKPKDLAAIGERWAPYRSVAAWYLWRATEA